MDSQFFDLLSRMDGKIDTTLEKVSNLEVTTAKLPCGVHEEKISTLRKILYPLVAIILTATVLSWSGSAVKAKKDIKVSTEGCMIHD